MNEPLKILAVIEHSNENLVSKLAEPISLSIGYRLPQDLKYYLENYDSIIFFEDSACSIKIVGVSEFKNANVAIVGENVDDDISRNWFVIADDHNSQYISIDLAKERLGYCYDSFWDRHGLPGEQAIIARTFTELLERLSTARGQIGSGWRRIFNLTEMRTTFVDESGEERHYYCTLNLY